MAAIRSTNGFVLAGGQSRRMGRDKAGLGWREGSLLEHMVALVGSVAGNVRVVGRGELPDRVPGNGPLGGILTALETTDAEENLIVAVDLPLLTVEFLAMFHERMQASSKGLVACRVEGMFPLCLGVRRGLAGNVAQRIADGRLSIQAFVEEADAEILETGFNPAIFANANTPEDFQGLTQS